jgi:putative transposase
MLLGKSRSWYYYTPYKDPKRIAHDQFDKTVIGKLSEMIPYYGYRKISFEAYECYGLSLSFKRAYRLRHEMNLHAVHIPIPTSTPRTAHAIYPYLLAGKKITYPNQVWQVDITYVRMPQGILYLCAIIDVYSRKILSWNLSNTMDIFLVLWPLTWALERYGLPEIINTDQGSQFTTKEWIGMVEDLNIKVSMNGKRRSLDNIFIERWWKSFKHEDFYLKQYETVTSLKRGISEYIEFYNTRRFHQSLDYKRPDEIYYQEEWALEKAS